MASKIYLNLYLNILSRKLSAAITDPAMPQPTALWLSFLISDNKCSGN